MLITDRRSLATEASAPFSEPLISTEIALSGCSVEVDRGLVHFVSWTLTRVGADYPAERRIVARSAMSIESARDLWSDLGALLRVDGAHRPGAYQLEVASAQLRDTAMDN